jgi:hypothetical protein
MGQGAGAGQLSYFMHLSGPSRAIKLLYAPVDSMGPKWHSPGWMPFPEPNPLPRSLVKDAARLKSITHGAV